MGDFLLPESHKLRPRNPGMRITRNNLLPAFPYTPFDKKETLRYDMLDIQQGIAAFKFAGEFGVLINAAVQVEPFFVNINALQGIRDVTVPFLPVKDTFVNCPRQVIIRFGLRGDNLLQAAFVRFQLFNQLHVFLPVIFVFVKSQTQFAYRNGLQAVFCPVTLNVAQKGVRIPFIRIPL